MRGVKMTMPNPVGGVEYDPLHLQQLLGQVSQKTDAMHSDSMKNMRNLSNLLSTIERQRQAKGSASGIRSSSGRSVSDSNPSNSPLEYHGPHKVGKWVDTAIRILGLNPSFKPGILNMIQHESGGNPNATNNWDSNASAGTPSMGLMQTIQPTFDAYNLPGHNQILNPVDNILAGVNYAIHRYGKGMVKRGGRRDSAGNYIGY
jgi:hypothetical protein